MSTDTPYDYRAEEHVLGAMLIAPSVVAELEEILEPHDFYWLGHGTIFRAACELAATGVPVDMVTLVDWLVRRGELEEVGGEPRIIELGAIVPSASNARHYAAIVRRRANERRARAIGQRLSNGELDPRLASEQLGALTRNIAGPAARHAVDGASWVLDATDHVPAVWGVGDQVLWSEGEPLMLCGPDGVGKTTLAQQLLLARCGILDSTLLDLPVVADQRPVMYIAADRPRQAARSLRRMVRTADNDVLRDRLIIWPWPLPFDVAHDPEALAAFVAEHGAGTVVLDSLKDIALDLVGDEAGSRAARALQNVIGSGIEVLVLHHQRKEHTGAKTIESVYGSRWLTSVCGSVLMLWGNPGSTLVRLHHLKQPCAVVGPFEIVHDHSRGRTSLSATDRAASHASTEPPLMDKVAEWATDNPGQPTNAVATGVGKRSEEVAAALRLAASVDLLRVEKGPHNALLWYPAVISSQTARKTREELPQAALPDSSSRPPFRGGRKRSEANSSHATEDPDARVPADARRP